MTIYQGSLQFTTPDKHAISNGMKTVSGGSDSEQTGILFKPFELRLQNKYYLGASFRVDGSSRLHRK